MNLELQIHDLIVNALSEDIRSGDITTETCISPLTQAKAEFILKQAGQVAGLPFIEVLFKKLDPHIDVRLCVSEGTFQKAGTVLATLSGSMQSILKGERVILNLLQHASGIATITSAYVKKVSGLKCAIMDTRKTLPGLRALEKYAVKIGGGKNHRYGLDDCLIIKKNHLAYLQKADQTITETVKKLKMSYPDLPIEIEIEDSKSLEDALNTEVEAIILLNMSPEEAKKYVERARKTTKKVYLESGGTITLDTVRAYAEKTGVDGIAIGDITHSVRALDIRMLLHQ